MKRMIIILTSVILACRLYGQDPEAARELVREGVRLHDEQAYDKALEKYGKALELDSNNFYAMAEKAVTFFQLGRTDDCVALCEEILQMQGSHEEIGMVYIAYANSLDHAERPEEALKVYARGQERDPGNHQLWYNEAITLIGLGRLDDAIGRLERSASLEPRHGSSHNAIGRIMVQNGQRIPAILAMSRFLIVEPEGKRAQENLELLNSLMKGNVEQNKKGGMTIHVDADAIEPKEGQPNDFSGLDMMIDLLAATVEIEKKEKSSEIGKFNYKFDMLCGLLADLRAKNSGFYWEHYVPYFVAMRSAGHLESAVMVMHATSDLTEVKKWLKGNDKAITAFYEWSSAYEWE